MNHCILPSLLITLLTKYSNTQTDYMDLNAEIDTMWTSFKGLLCIMIAYKEMEKRVQKDFLNSHKINKTRMIENIVEIFLLYQEKFNKTYTGYYDTIRMNAWKENLDKIERHNNEADKGIHTYYIKENHLTDMSPRSYLQKMVKLTMSRHRKVDTETVGDFYEMIHHLPEQVNWLDYGFKTPTYNQKDCGSCYAFSIVGSIQGQLFKQTKKLVPLSEQQVIDCSVKYGNYGCGGGSLRNTLRYLERAGGLMTYIDYPYVSKQQRCVFDKNQALVNITSWAVLPARDERALEIAVAKIGPVAVSINASPHTFQLYHSGIYDDPSCTSNHVNHAMLVVGYTKDYWILKNWWGSHWGENGYMRLRRNKNRCGIANYAAYALI